MKIRHGLIWLLMSGMTLLASFGVSFLYVRSQLDLVEVIVAKQDITPRTKITESDLIKVEVPKALVSAEHYITSKEVVNLYVKIQHSIPKGSLIYHNSVETLDESIDTPSLLLREHQALMSLNVDIIKTAGKTIQAGQKIDIYGALKLNREIFVDRLFMNVRVLGVLDKNGEALTNNPKQVPKIMLVAIHQDYVSILTKLIAMGELTITTTAGYDHESECVLNEDSPLLEFLYVQ
jgi:Flp pilus assembly protein CpaB